MPLKPKHCDYQKNNGVLYIKQGEGIDDNTFFMGLKTNFNYYTINERVFHEYMYISLSLSHHIDTY